MREKRQMNTKLDNICEEIKKYSSGIHQLNESATGEMIMVFEKRYNIIIPDSYKKWLKRFNG